MTRRLFIGKAGASFRIRQSLPGHDALTASLDGIVFDSEYFPGHVVGSGSFATNSPASAASRPHSMSSPHGLGRKPDIVLAMATGTDPANGVGTWEGRITNNGVAWSPDYVGNAAMIGRYCTPFIYNRGAIYAQGPNQGTLQSFASGGWEYYWDSVYIGVQNYCYSSLHIKWIALDL